MKKSKSVLIKKLFVSAAVFAFIFFSIGSAVFAFRLIPADQASRFTNGVTDPYKVEGLLNAQGYTLDPSKATQENAGGGIAGIIAELENIINLVVPFLIGLAVLIIIYGILGYISKTADEEKRKEAQSFIVWGIVGIFIMVSVWGLVNILVKTFNFGSSNTNSVVTDIYKPATIPTAAPTTLLELIARVNAIGSYVIPFLIGIGVFILLIGIVNYIRQGDNEEKRAEGRMFIIWGIVSIFVMLSVWGLVNILVQSFNLNQAIPNIPALPTL